VYAPKHLKKWVEQINFDGDNFDNYYVAYWRFFRCSPLERSNFRYIRDHLREHNLPEGALIFPAFTDEVMLCRYYIMIHEDCDKGLRIADMFARRVAADGSLDPESEVRLDAEAMDHRWHRMNRRARILMCAEAGVSIFLSRAKDFPAQNEELTDLLSEASL
jgi:hypothetical protein